MGYFLDKRAKSNAHAQSLLGGSLPAARASACNASSSSSRPVNASNLASGPAASNAISRAGSWSESFVVAQALA